MTSGPSWGPPGYPLDSHPLLEEEIAGALKEGLTKASKLEPPNSVPPVLRQTEIQAVAEVVARRTAVSLTGFAGSGTSTVAIQAARQAAKLTGGRISYIDLARTRKGQDIDRRLWLALGLPVRALRESREPSNFPVIGSRAVQEDDVVVLDNCPDNWQLAPHFELPASIQVQRSATRPERPRGSSKMREHGFRLAPLGDRDAYGIVSQFVPTSHGEARPGADELVAWAQGSALVLRVASALAAQGASRTRPSFDQFSGRRGDHFEVLAELIWRTLTPNASRVLGALVFGDWLQVNTSNVAVLAEVPPAAASAALEELRFLGVIQKVPRAFRLQRSLRKSLRHSRARPRTWDEVHRSAALRYVDARSRRVVTYLGQFHTSSVPEEWFDFHEPAQRRSFTTLVSDIEWLDREWDSILELLEDEVATNSRRDIENVVTTMSMCAETMARKSSLQRLDELGYTTNRVKEGPGERRQSLRKLALQYESQGLVKDALGVSRQNLALSRSGGDADDTIVDLLDVGRLSHLLGASETSIDALEEAIALSRASGFSEGEARALMTLGEVYEATGQTDAAVPAYSRAIQLLNAPEQRRTRALAFLNLGTIHESRDRLAEAEDAFRSAANLLVGLDEGELFARSLEMQGRALARSGRLEEARSTLGRALSLLHAFGDVRGRARILLQLELIEERAGDFVAAEGHISETMATVAGVDIPVETGLAQLALSRLRREQGRTEEALSLIAVALNTFQEAGLVQEEARARLVFAQELAEARLAKEAIEQLSSARDIFRRLGDQARAAETQYALGLAYQSSGEHAAAVSELEASADVERRLGRKSSERAALEALKVSYSELGWKGEMAALDQRVAMLTSNIQSRAERASDQSDESFGGASTH